MRYVHETSLYDFKFWSGAVQRAEKFNRREMDMIESQLEEIYLDDLTDTEINDLFWFEEDFIAQLAGYKDYETMCEAKEDEDE